MPLLAQVDPVSSATTLAPYLAGPGAATLVLLLVGAACYKLVVSHLIPMISKALDRHLAQIDTLIQSQREEATQQTKALKALENAVRALERRLDGSVLDGGRGAV